MIELTRPERIALNRLSNQWLVLTFLNALFLVSIYAILRAEDQLSMAIRWILLSAGISYYFLSQVWRWLPLNYLPGKGELLAFLGAGNILTIGRGVLLAGLAGFLFSPRPPEGVLIWIPGLLYTLAVCADLLDGTVARRAGQSTRLGEKLDLFLDGFGVLFAGVLLVQYGLVPGWYLVVGFARYLFLAGIWLRRWYGKPVYDLPASRLRRPLAGFQMGFMAVALWPIFSPTATTIAAVIFGAPFLANFALDWLRVNGLVSAGEFTSQRKSQEV